nr:hypothetical protein [Tanacetum cinerariifolium]
MTYGYGLGIKPTHKMAEENVPALTRTDAQLVPIKAHLPIGKSNLFMEYYKKYLDMEARTHRQPTTMMGEEVEKKKAPKADKPFAQPQDDTSVNVVHDTSSPTDSTNDDDTTEVSNTMALEERTVKLDEGHSRSDPDKTPESQPPPERKHKEEDQAISDPRQIHVSQAGPNPKPMHEDFRATPKPVKKKTSKPTPSKKIYKGKRSDHLVDEEPKPASELQVEDDEYNLQRRFIRKLPDVEGKGKGNVTDEQVAQSLVDLQKPKKQNSTNDAETIADMEESNNETDTEILNVIEILDQTLVKHPSLGLYQSPTTEDQVHIENPPSLSETLSSIKNLGDVFTFGDQFLNDKLRKEEPRRANVETEVESMVTVPIHQASSSVPLLSPPIINLSHPKPVSPPVQELIITAKTTTTITLPPPPLRPPRSTIDLDLATRVSALEMRSADFEQKNKLQDKTTQALASKIYKSHLDHTTLYEALEASMQHENNDELHAALTKSRKRRCNDQDPPPPSLEESDRSKKKKHDSNVSALKQPPVKKSSSWKTSDSREAPLAPPKYTGAAHLPKIKTRPDWLTSLPEDETPKTPEPDWVIPPYDLLETENN